MDEGYINLIFSIQGLNYNTLWKLFLLGFMRFAPICGLAPFLGAKVVPVTVRAGLAFALTAVFLPTILLNSDKATSMMSSLFVFYSMKEILIGFILGFVCSVPFWIAQSSGIFIDYARGASSMMGQDASTQSQASPIGILLNSYLIVLFYSLGGPFYFFDAIGTSFEVIGVDSFIPSSFYSKNNSFWVAMIDLCNQIFAISIQLAAPCLVAILMAESFLGIANRLAPNVQISFLGMPIKSLLGLTLLWAGWYVIARKLGDFSIDWMQNINKLIPFLQK
jgi:type III secretion protein T